MVPTKERNVSSHYLDYKGEGILFDCGEGTQRQMNIGGLNRHKIKKIFLTHWHGDHVSGLIGLIQTIGNKEEAHVLDIFGPKETKKRISSLIESCDFQKKVEIKIKEANPRGLEKIYENKDYFVEVINLYHSIPTIGYRFVEKDKIKIRISKLKREGVKEGPHIKRLQEGKDMIYKGKTYKNKDYTSVIKGKIFSYVPDTAYGPNCVKIAENADILLCESTFAHSLSEKAKETKHITSREAAQIASQANAKKLILTHFSQRYTEIKEVLDDAKDIFPNTEAGFDFMKVVF